MAQIKVEAVQKYQHSTLYTVKDGPKLIGFLEKYTNTRTETHPWKPFLPHTHKPFQVGQMLEPVYGANAKQLAIQQLVDAARKEAAV